MDRLMAGQPLADDHPVIAAGDLNIAHTEQDIHNAKGNKKNSASSHTSEWFTKLSTAAGTTSSAATSASNKAPTRGGPTEAARELNRGWRIDYLLGNAAAKKRLKRRGSNAKAGSIPATTRRSSSSSTKRRAPTPGSSAGVVHPRPVNPV